MEKRTSITQVIYDDEGIVELQVVKVVKKVGKGGHVMLPRDLIGKKVIVNYKRGENGVSK